MILQSYSRQFRCVMLHGHRNAIYLQDKRRSCTVLQQFLDSEIRCSDTVLWKKINFDKQSQDIGSIGRKITDTDFNT